MQLEQRLGAELRQEHRLSQHMIASLELMALPVYQLDERINQELENNPALEMESSPVTESIDTYADAFQKIERDANNEQNDEYYSAYNGNADIDRIAHRLTRSESLTEHLLAQLRLRPLSDHEYTVGEIIIDNLDDNGFHTDDPLTMPRITSMQDDNTVRHIIHLIQTFDPYGICVANVRESLALQARLLGGAPHEASTILNSATLFTMLEENKRATIAKDINVSNDAIDSAAKYIATLTPYPGRAFSIHHPQYIMPDLHIFYADNKFHIGLNHKARTNLKINKFFLEICDTNNKHRHKKNELLFAKSYIQEGKHFINSLHKRNQTLIRTAYALLERQHDFFRFGPQHLAPLTLKDIAAMLNLHETTISRVSNKKYIETNWGTFPISFLFSNRVSRQSGDSISRIAVREKIYHIMTAHKNRRISDQAIADMLAHDNIHISRRTVNKYRNEILLDSNRKI